jgi:hypothetical protein
MNCCVAPRSKDAVGGEILIDTKAGGPIFNVAAAEVVPMVAVISVDPWPALVARPEVGTVLLMTATVANEEVQDTVAVRS